MNRDCSSSESEVLLPPNPVGCIRDYGINNADFVDANDKELSNSSVAAIIPSKSFRRQRVWAEAACSLIACLASLMIGMIVGFSSPTLTQLDRPEHLNQQIEAGTIYASVFGVSNQMHYKCIHDTIVAIHPHIYAFLILYILCVHVIGSCFNWCYSWESNCLASLGCFWPKTCPHDWRSSCVNWLVDDQFIFSYHQQPQCFPRSHSYWQAIHWSLCRMVFLLCICKHFHFPKKNVLAFPSFTCYLLIGVRFRGGINQAEGFIWNLQSAICHSWCSYCISIWSELEAGQNYSVLGIQHCWCSCGDHFRGTYAVHP